MNRRRTIALLAAAGVLAFGAFVYAANITYGVDLTVTFLKATKAGGNVEMDEKIKPGVKSQLFRTFRSKYKKYTYLSEETRFAHMSKNEEYVLPDDRGSLTVRVTGYKQLWINFLVTLNGGKATSFRISHGYYFALSLGPEDEPLIVVLFAKKVETQT